MKTRSFALSVIISASLQSIYIVAISIVTMFLLPSLLNSVNLDATSGPPPGFTNFMWVSTAIGGIGFVLAPLVHAGTGVLYAWLHHRESFPVTTEKGAVGGAAAAGVARIIAGVLLAIGSLLTTSLIFQNISTQVPITPGDVPGGMPFVIGMGIFSGLIGSLVGTCLGGILAAALGGLGGSIAGALLK